MQQIIQRDRLGRDVTGARHVGIDRQDEVVVAELHAGTGQVDDNEGVGTGLRDLFGEILRELAQRGAIEVGAGGDLEADLAEGLRHQARIVGADR